MRIVALLAVRNEELYLARCLEHLLAQGIEVHLIDHGSTDATPAIAREFARRGGVTVESFPYRGLYEWGKILQRKEELAAHLPADWFIHHDADEIREAPAPWRTLAEGIAAVDEEGYNAIDFAEVVFTPTGPEESFEGRDYVAEMRHYYPFAPRPEHRVNAWKNLGARVDLASSGGHRVQFPRQRLYPQPFVLRHYVFLSLAHLCRKYGERTFDPAELSRGWHGQRAAFRAEGVRFPPREFFQVLGPDGRFDLSQPRRRHFFLARPTAGEAGDR